MDEFDPMTLQSQAEKNKLYNDESIKTLHTKFSIFFVEVKN